MVKFIREQVNNSSSGNFAIDETTLVAKAKAGDMVSVERLILRYQDRLYNAVVKMCSSPDDAAELTQDAFVKAIQGLKNFRGQSSFYTWLFRIAMNHTLSFCSRNKKLKFESLQAELGTETQKHLAEFLEDKHSPNPESVAISRELQELVTQAIAKLDPDHRAVVVLRDIEQMSYAEIAETIDIEVGTVKSRISRGRKNLREILEAVLK